MGGQPRWALILSCLWNNYIVVSLENTVSAGTVQEGFGSKRTVFVIRPTVRR
jgi:hypothetical protein